VFLADWASWLTPIMASPPTTTGSSTTAGWPAEPRSASPRRRACCSGSARAATCSTLPAGPGSTRRCSPAGASACGRPTGARLWSRSRRRGSGGKGWRSRSSAVCGRTCPPPSTGGSTSCCAPATRWCTPLAATTMVRAHAVLVQLTQHPMPVEGVGSSKSPPAGELVRRSGTVTVQVWHSAARQPRRRTWQHLR
jgi:hypothetical protein